MSLEHLTGAYFASWTVRNHHIVRVTALSKDYILFLFYGMTTLLPEVYLEYVLVLKVLNQA